MSSLVFSYLVWLSRLPLHKIWSKTHKNTLSNCFITMKHVIDRKDRWPWPSIANDNDERSRSQSIIVKVDFISYKMSYLALSYLVWLSRLPLDKMRPNLPMTNQIYGTLHISCSSTRQPTSWLVVAYIALFWFVISSNCPFRQFRLYVNRFFVVSCLACLGWWGRWEQWRQWWRLQQQQREEKMIISNNDYGAAQAKAIKEAKNGCEST